MRIILFTGKGGVGKTSLAAATALLASRQGYKTICISTDPAHSLADSLDVPLSGAPKEVAKNFWAEEINVQQKIEENYDAIRSYLATLFASQAVDEVVAEELAVFPGTDELFSLIEINTFYSEKTFDFLVIDCAPTGATLRLLAFPDTAGWYMRKIFPIERKVAKYMKPVVNRLASLPFIPGDEFYKTIKNIYEKAGFVSKVLADPKISSVRLVMNPEKMVIKEAQRAYTYLNLFGFPTDSCIVNRVMPDAITDPYFAEWKHIQKDYMNLIHQAFHPLPIFQAPLYEKEVVGFDALERLAKDIYGDKDPTKVFYKGKTMDIKKLGRKEYVMRLKLPFLKKEDIDLKQVGDELLVRVGNFKRNILLPDSLMGLSPEGAKFEDEDLVIRFS